MTVFLGRRTMPISQMFDLSFFQFMPISLKFTESDLNFAVPGPDFS